mmetsp:Transcript_59018/g.140940  ORF Transcript_59018/g.140940 Transcript_59018/m.140940 type:complete len:263 (+) Transcript_59018:1142-1930(+)
MYPAPMSSSDNDPGAGGLNDGFVPSSLPPALMLASCLESNGSVAADSLDGSAGGAWKEELPAVSQPLLPAAFSPSCCCSRLGICNAPAAALLSSAAGGGFDLLEALRLGSFREASSGGGSAFSAGVEVTSPRRRLVLRNMYTQKPHVSKQPAIGGISQMSHLLSCLSFPSVCLSESECAICSETLWDIPSVSLERTVLFTSEAPAKWVALAAPEVVNDWFNGSPHAHNPNAATAMTTWTMLAAMCHILIGHLSCSPVWHQTT